MRGLWEWLRKSLTVKGVITTAAGVLCDPNVLGLLPPGAARSVAVIGAACTVLGIRRALPAPAGGVAQLLSPITPADVVPSVSTADPRGLTPGETAVMQSAASVVDWDRFGKGTGPKP